MDDGIDELAAGLEEKADGADELEVAVELNDEALELIEVFSFGRF